MTKPPTEVMLTCRVDRHVVVALNVVAKQRKLTRSELIRQALLRVLKDAA